MTDAIIILVLLVIGIYSVKHTLKHFNGKGSCCGGGGNTIFENKKLDGEIIAEKIISIEGMHCDNCKNRVERRINKIDGVAAVVDLKKNIAVVSMEKEISDDMLKEAVESVDFKVIDIILNAKKK